MCVCVCVLDHLALWCQEAICEVIDLPLQELVRIMPDDKGRVGSLTDTPDRDRPPHHSLVLDNSSSPHTPSFMPVAGERHFTYLSSHQGMSECVHTYHPVGFCSTPCLLRTERYSGPAGCRLAGGWCIQEHIHTVTFPHTATVQIALYPLTTPPTSTHPPPPQPSQPVGRTTHAVQLDTAQKSPQCATDLHGNCLSHLIPLSQLSSQLGDGRRRGGEREGGEREMEGEGREGERREGGRGERDGRGGKGRRGKGGREGGEERGGKGKVEKG